MKEISTEKLRNLLFNKVGWANIVNCTPHDIKVYANVSDIGQPDSFIEITTLKPSGAIPRVKIAEVEHPDVDRFPFPLVRNETGPVEGLPKENGKTFFIVSRMVFEATTRKDVIAPDTGASAVRSPEGRVLGVTQFVGK